MSEVLEKPKAEAKPEKKALKKWKITFHSGGDNDNPDNSDVELSHNFRLNLYKRNVETVIDENYLSVLKDAVIKTTITTVAEDGKTKNVQSVSIPRFSYTLGEQVA